MHTFNNSVNEPFHAYRLKSESSPKVGIAINVKSYRSRAGSVRTALACRVPWGLSLCGGDYSSTPDGNARDCPETHRWTGRAPPFERKRLGAAFAIFGIALCLTLARLSANFSLRPYPRLGRSQRPWRKWSKFLRGFFVRQCRKCQASPVGQAISPHGRPLGQREALLASELEPCRL
jgi:hypothetical protein